MSNDAWMPIKQDIEVMPADDSVSLKLGLIAREHPVSVLGGPWGLMCDCKCGESWEVSSWEEARKTSDEHYMTSDKHKQEREEINE
jgi:hypothetical protein